MSDPAHSSNEPAERNGPCDCGAGYDVKRLRLEPGDVLVVTVPPLSPEAQAKNIEAIQAALKRAGHDKVPILVKSAESELSILSAAEPCSVCSEGQLAQKAADTQTITSALAAVTVLTNRAADNLKEFPVPEMAPKADRLAHKELHSLRNRLAGLLQRQSA